MIVVADINAIWRIKPFDALSGLLPVAGVSPRRWFGPDPDVLGEASEALTVSRVSLPPGWASIGAVFSARTLLDRLRAFQPTGLFVTSPHYLPLARLATREMAVYYYCSDDYAEYEGWGGKLVEDRERELIACCEASFFVSRVLAEKAVQVLGADSSKVHVSPNATDHPMVEDFSTGRDAEVAALMSRLTPPVVGVVGAINDRLDFEILLDCARLPEVGTLLLVGPVAGKIGSPVWQALKGHPKCVITGGRPHGEIRSWMLGLDVGLIPYAESQLNRACSPMRLFDHLAAGKPIVATSACDQVADYDEFLFRGTTRREVVESVRQQCLGPGVVLRPPEFLARLTWASRAEFIANHL